MRPLTAAVVIFGGLCTGVLWGQASWPSYPNNTTISVTSAGNVGIGTTNPGSRLSLSGVGSTDSGQADVQITGTGTVGGGVNLISSDVGGRNWLLISTGSATGIPGSLGFYDPTDGAYRLVVSPAGNVGIGTTDPCTNSQAPSNCKLSVAGAIQAQEVVVNTGWSDYVFNPDYRLAPLTEVAGYIQENHHLPGIPSEAEVKDKGVSLGDMQAKLLAKIEELTSYMIQADERNKALEERIARLESELSQKEDREK